MARKCNTPLWLNTRTDPASLAVGKLRRMVAKLKPGARQLHVQTQSEATLLALEQWCQHHGVLGSAAHDSGSWTLTLFLLPDALGGRFAPAAPPLELAA